MRIASIPKGKLLAEEIQETWKMQKAYMNLMCSKIDEETGILNTKLSEIAEGFDDLNQVLTYQENLHAMNEGFYRGINIFWNSFFVASFSLFEYQLIRMCRRAQDNHAQSKSPQKRTPSPKRKYI